MWPLIPDKPFRFSGIKARVQLPFFSDCIDWLYKLDTQRDVLPPCGFRVYFMQALDCWSQNLNGLLVILFFGQYTHGLFDGLVGFLQLHAGCFAPDFPGVLANIL